MLELLTAPKKKKNSFIILPQISHKLEIQKHWTNNQQEYLTTPTLLDSTSQQTTDFA